MPSLPIRKPTKPFGSYAWHWASFQPTEGLLVPPVYFGVLRALRACEGEPKSSAKVRGALEKVERDTLGIRSRSLHLARASKRNLIRNAGQYWQALGLLEDSPGTLHLTRLGQKVADGLVPVDDFVAATVRNLKLPNPNNQSADDVALWNASGISIEPLRLILEILLRIPENSFGERFITADELWRIVIPLAGEMAAVDAHVRAIKEARVGNLDISDWPDCTPKANDRRSATEFLIFLARNGLLKWDKLPRRADWRFVLEPAHAELARLILDHAVGNESIEEAVAEATNEQLSVQVARTRRLVEQIHRPNQAKFKKGLLKDHGQKCVITGETAKAVLIGAHIIPVEYNGDDSSANGLPLRADIHLLFDAGLLKIHPDGQVELHQSIQTSPSYGNLPPRIVIPKKVKESNLRWRLDSL